MRSMPERVRKKSLTNMTSCRCPTPIPSSATSCTIAKKSMPTWPSVIGWVKRFAKKSSGDFHKKGCGRSFSLDDKPKDTRREIRGGRELQQEDTARTPPGMG